MNHSKFFTFLAIAIAVITSCNRTEKDENAGKGGNASLKIVLKHHNEAKSILNGKVYIKYNAQDAPSSFDDSTNCVMLDGVPTGSISGLKKGKYYLYGTGYDTTVSQAVKGGIPYEIKEEISYDISLPVTESNPH